MEDSTLTSKLVEAGATATTNLSPHDRLRVLRVHVQDLQTLLDRVRKGDAVLITYARCVTDLAEAIDEVVHTALEDARGRVHSRLDIPLKKTDQKLSLLQRLGLKSRPELESTKKTDKKRSPPDPPDLDEIQHLDNIWRQIKTCPVIASPAIALTAQEQLRDLTLLDDQFREIVFRIGVKTIPPRLNDKLAELTPGYYLPFHTIFGDELPSYDDRVRILNDIAYSPASLSRYGGIVDTSNGLVYRYARHFLSQLGTLAVAVLSLFGFSLLVFLSSFITLPGWPINVNDQAKLVFGWGAILVGIMVHLAVASSKRAQAHPGLPPVMAIGDLLPTINAKFGPICLKLFLALFAFFGFVFSSGIAQVTVMNAFLVGYSLDSFVELFSGAVEQRASAQATSLKQKLNGK